MTIIVIVSIILFFLGLYITKNDLLSPQVITPAVWAICSILWFILPHNLPDLSSQFIVALLIWLCAVCFSSNFVCFTKFRENSILSPNLLVRDLYLVICIITTISFLFYIQEVLAQTNSLPWPTKLRNAAISGIHGNEPYGGIQLLLWQVSFLVELYYFQSRKWYRLVIPACSCLIYSFFTMAKIGFIVFFLQIVCFIYYKYTKIDFKKLFFAGLILFVFIIQFQSLRSGQDVGENKGGFFTLYLLSSMSAFDTLEPCSSLHFAENIAMPLYRIFYKLGLSSVEPINAILPFINEPIYTNTYTCMYPFFVDFGFWGVGIFGVVMGSIFGWMHKKMKMGNPIFYILYVYFFFTIVMQYAADQFFTPMINHAYFIILLLLAYLPTKLKIPIDK